jgi:hypothetical protein
MAIQRDHAADQAFAANVAISDDLENLVHADNALNARSQILTGFRPNVYRTALIGGKLVFPVNNVSGIAVKI